MKNYIATYIVKGSGYYLRTPGPAQPVSVKIEYKFLAENEDNARRLAKEFTRSTDMKMRALTIHNHGGSVRLRMLKRATLESIMEVKPVDIGSVVTASF